MYVHSFILTHCTKNMVLFAPYVISCMPSVLFVRKEHFITNSSIHEIGYNNEGLLRGGAKL